MRKYDEIVVGSGISGMTLALLLGLNGRSVLLLEKSPQLLETSLLRPVRAFGGRKKPFIVPRLRRPPVDYTPAAVGR